MLEAKKRLLADLDTKVVLKKINERRLQTVDSLRSKGINLNHCHTKVALAIQERQVLTDIIWLYGNSVDDITHSVLTDRAGKVLVGAVYTAGANRFLGDKGFQIADEIYPLQRKLTVKELFNGSN
jgi:hypothetical protein